MIRRLKVHSQDGVRLRLQPSPLTSQEIKSLHQEIGARRLFNELRRQRFVENLFRLGKFLFVDKNASQPLAVH